MGNCKVKTRRGAAKRFKATGSGYKRKSANRSHILTKMTAKRKRRLRGVSPVDAADMKAVRRMLGGKSGKP